ncbi:hypothetical protein Q7P35_011038 [Cladosporium inversicolor]
MPSTIQPKLKSCPIANPSSTTGNLHKLPAELRNWIYEACLIPRDKPYQVEKVVKPHQARFVYSKGLADMAMPMTVPPRLLVQEPALLRVSKAVRRETLSIHYGTNTFRLLTVAILKDWLVYIGSERRAVLRYVQCMELPIPLTRLFLRFKAPPLYHTLHALEYFEMRLAQDGLEISTGALHFPLCFRRSKGHEWQVCSCGTLRRVNNEIWSSASDVARRLSDQDWQSYVDIRLAVEKIRASLIKNESGHYDQGLAHELAFESVNG